MIERQKEIINSNRKIFFFVLLQAAIRMYVCFLPFIDMHLFQTKIDQDPGDL